MSDLEVNIGSPRLCSSVAASSSTLWANNPYAKYLNLLRQSAAGPSIKPDVAAINADHVIRSFLAWYDSLQTPNKAGDTINEDMLRQLYQVGLGSPRLRRPQAAVPLRNRHQNPDEPWKPRASQPWQIPAYQDSKKVFGAERGSYETPGQRRRSSPPPAMHSVPLESPGRLEELAPVFEGIEELWSVVAFGQWLNEHPELNPPPYLTSHHL